MKKYISIDFGRNHPIISCPQSSIKAKIDKKSLAQLVLNSSKPQKLNELLESNGFEDRGGIENVEMEHWIKRNWTHSLYYYLWSRKNHLEDKGLEFQEIQKKVLEDYKNIDGLPPEIKKVKNAFIKVNCRNSFQSKSLSEVLQKRKSVRSCPKRAIDSNEIFSVLYEGTRSLRDNRLNIKISEDILNAVNSFGVAFDIYLCAYNVLNLESGIYFYDPESAELEVYKLIDTAILREKMFKAQTEQVIANNASYAILLVSHFERYQWRYRHEAALQHIYINAGQIMHPLVLMATQFGHATHISPAINDDLMNDLMGHKAIDHQTIYIMSAG